MKLAEFILRDMEAILVEWEAFAVTLFPPSATPTRLMLRDHAQQILEAVAKDLETVQTRQAQMDKSLGRAAKLIGAPETAAETHAILRAKSGFDINQMVAEYRALRATILRRWMDAFQLDSTAANDIIRFNEAIDQAIAESIAAFSEHVVQARNLLLGMLGHDMRSPLSTIQMTATYLALLDDLIDFSRTKLGLGINISSNKTVDLASLFTDEVEQLRGAHPRRQLELAIAGDTQGSWDGLRIQQVLRNLLSNAIKYGLSSARVLHVHVTPAPGHSLTCQETIGKLHPVRRLQKSCSLHMPRRACVAIGRMRRLRCT